MLIDELLARHEVLCLRRLPRCARTIQRAAADGRLQPILPGVYLRPGEPTPLLRLKALCSWRDDVVATGRTALQLHLAQPLTLPLEVATLSRLSSRPRWVRLTRTTMPPHHVFSRGGVRFVSRALACVQLAATDEGRAVFEALREGVVGPLHLAEALQTLHGSPGQPERRAVVELAVANPWSYAEGRLHRLLRRARLPGWRANPRLFLAGVLVVPDVLFDAERLVLEFDGEAVHSDHRQFERDRSRQNLLVVAHYRVLRITWEMLTEHPDEVLATIRAALRRAAA